MSRKTTARRATAAAVAAAVLVPGFALGIADAAANSPAITGLNVSAVKAGAPATVSITGKNLDNVGEVAYVADGSTRAASIPLDEDKYIIVSPTKIVVEVPSLTAGRYHLFVTEGDDASVDTAKDDFLATSNPAVTSMSAVTGPASSGQKLLVTGSGFTGVSRVVFRNGGVEYPVKGFKVLTDATLEVTTGELPAGDNVLEATNLSGTNAVTNATYTASVVTAKASPVLLSEQGGDIVTVIGSGLAAAVDNDAVQLVHRGLVTTTYKVQAKDIVAVSNVELVFRTPSADAFDSPTGAEDGAAVVKTGEPFEVVIGKIVTGSLTLANNSVTGYKALTLMYAPKPEGALDVPGVAFGNTVQEATIVGRNLKGAKVTVGSTTAFVKSVSADGTRLVFRVPTNPKKIASLVVPTVSRDVFVTTKEGIASIGKVYWNDSATLTDAYIESGTTMVLTGSGLASVSASDILLDGVALPATTVLTRDADTEIRFPFTGGADEVELKNAATKILGGLAVDEEVDRTIVSAQYTDNVTDGTLLLTGTNLKNLEADSLVFNTPTGDGAFKVKLTSSTSTTATYSLTAPIGGSYEAPWNAANVAAVDTDGSGGAADGDYDDAGDVAPKTRTTVTAPRVSPIVPLS